MIVVSGVEFFDNKIITKTRVQNFAKKARFEMREFLGLMLM